MTSSGHDHHGDHTHGNHLFRPAAVIGHAALSDPERIVGNLHRAYAELDGAAPGAPIDLRAAITDMVSYNGGPLRCLA